MIRQIAPVFFTRDIPATVAWYESKLGFKCLGTWQDPPVYAIVARDQRAIHFRCAEPPTANPEKYSDERLDAYVFVEDAASGSPFVPFEGWGPLTSTIETPSVWPSQLTSSPTSKSLAP